MDLKMQLVFALYFLFAVIYWFLRFIEWVLKLIGIIKPIPDPYSFEKDILKPLGFNSVDYQVKPDISRILRVQKRLEEEIHKRVLDSDWFLIKHDLDMNRKMEETFIDRKSTRLNSSQRCI